MLSSHFQPRMEIIGVKYALLGLRRRDGCHFQRETPLFGGSIADLSVITLRANS